METHVCENVHTEFYPELLLRLPPGSLNVGYREHSVAVFEKNAV